MPSTRTLSNVRPNVRTGRAGRRRRQRWLAGALAAVLLSILGFSGFASWQQTTIVRELVDEGSDTNAYQETAYLATTEMSLLQATQREPRGEERKDLLRLVGQTTAALDHVATVDEIDVGRSHLLARLQHQHQPQIARYLDLLRAGDAEAAGALLEVVFVLVFVLLFVGLC